MTTKAVFGQRLPRPRRTQPIPINQLRLDRALLTLRAARREYPEAVAYLSVGPGAAVAVLPGGGSKPVAPVAAIAKARAAA